METIFGTRGFKNRTTMIYYAASGMRSSASTWWFNKMKGKQIVDHWTDWTGFKKDVTKFFHPSNYSLLLCDDLKKLKQMSSVWDYIMKFQNIVGQITDMGEADQISYFIDVLKPITKIEPKS